MTSSALVARIILLITISTINIELSRAESNRGSQDLIPRTSLTNLKLGDFSSTGSLDLVLEATSLNQDVSTGVSQVTNPFIKLEGSRGVIWSIKSLRGNISGRVNDSEQRIELSGEVLISRSAGLGQNLVITSESFVFVPQKNFGETLSPVTINLGQNTITAAELSIDLNKEELRLDSSSTQYVSSEVFGKSQK